jgi:hypothetical protein
MKQLLPPRVAVIDGEIHVGLEFLLRAVIEDVARHHSEDIFDLRGLISDLETGSTHRSETSQQARIDTYVDTILATVSADLVLSCQAAHGLRKALSSLLPTAVG